MANEANTEIKGTCMLVSDSNESSNQLDSKKLGYDTLVELAQDNLFKKYLDMSRYLTKNQYEIYKGLLEDEYKQLSDMSAITGNPKLRAVDGQVILVEVANLPSGKSPIQWVQDNWEIPPGFQLHQIPNCMLRGMLESGNRDTSLRELPIEKPTNQQVTLKKENVPNHMHHSSITKDANITTMWGDDGEHTYYVQGNTIFDMFYNDSMASGLQKNELDGTSDQFTVNPTGKGDEDNPEMMHDNMPKYHAFYGFVVQDPTVTNS